MMNSKDDKGSSAAHVVAFLYVRRSAYEMAR